MELNPKGRTLQAYPATWLSLRTPRSQSELAGLVRAAVDARTVVDLTASPGLFGGLLGREYVATMLCGNTEWVRSPNADVAATIVQAQVIEGLCGVGREQLDFYFLRVPDGAQPFQIEGAVAVLDGAMKEGHIANVGVVVAGSVDSARKAFLSDSLFKLALCSTDSQAEELRPLVEARGGLVITAGLGSAIAPILVPVASEAEVLVATRQLEPV